MFEALVEEPADMAAAEVKVLGRLVDIDRPVLVEDPAANLLFPPAEPLQSPIDLKRPGLRPGQFVFPAQVIEEIIIGALNSLDTTSLSKTMVLEQHPEEGHEPMDLLLLLGRGQGLEGSQGRFLKHILLVTCHVRSVGGGDPVDEAHVLGNPLPGLQPGCLGGGVRRSENIGHCLSRDEHGNPSLPQGMARWGKMGNVHLIFPVDMPGAEKSAGNHFVEAEPEFGPET